MFMHKHTSGGVGGIQENSSWERQRIVRGRESSEAEIFDGNTQRILELRENKIYAATGHHGRLLETPLLLVGQDQGGSRLM